MCPNLDELVPTCYMVAFFPTSEICLTFQLIPHLFIAMMWMPPIQIESGEEVGTKHCLRLDATWDKSVS